MIINKIYYRSKNHKLCGILSKADDSKKIVLLCHGLNSTKEESGSFTALSDYLNQHSINTFRFDFFAHGESDGTKLEFPVAEETQNLNDTLSFLIDNGYDCIIILGASFGGGIVSMHDYKNYPQVKAIILWYPALTFENSSVFNQCNQNIAKEKGYFIVKSTRSDRKLKLKESAFMEVKGLYPYKYLSEIHKPILLIQGDEDTITPLQVVLDLFNEISFCKLEIVEHGTHGFPISNVLALNKAIYKTHQFIKDHIQFF